MTLLADLSLRCEAHKFGLRYCCRKVPDQIYLIPEGPCRSGGYRGKPAPSLCEECRAKVMKRCQTEKGFREKLLQDYWALDGWPRYSRASSILAYFRRAIARCHGH